MNGFDLVTLLLVVLTVIAGGAVLNTLIVFVLAALAVGPGTINAARGLLAFIQSTRKS